MSRVVTFYSYKGGAGRSMALANVALVLASNGKRILVIDWDLEAPGLHRYFSPFLFDSELMGDASQGVIDFVFDFAIRAATALSEDRADDWFEQYADISRWSQKLTWPSQARLNTEQSWGSIDFVPAGRQGPDYAKKVNSFDWGTFYRQFRGEAFLESVKRKTAKYDYVLIDSRTGVSDTAGICTVQMPQTVVVCFTLNHQSILGSAAVAASIKEQRPEVRIFPVPSRVDSSSEKRLSDSMKKHARQVFSGFLNDSVELDKYWFEMELQYQPRYAYAEILAPFEEQTSISSSLLPSVELLTSYITDGTIYKMGPLPEQHRREVLACYERIPGETEEGAESPADVTTVYVVCSPSEWGDALRLKQCLEAERRFTVVLPIRDVDDDSVRLRDHRATLKSCDAVLVYWGASSPISWFREQQREVIGALQKRRSKPFPAICLSLSPQANPAANALPVLPIQQISNLDCASVRRYFHLLEASKRRLHS